jgi:hypothetical protein
MDFRSRSGAHRPIARAVRPSRSSIRRARRNRSSGAAEHARGAGQLVLRVNYRHRRGNLLVGSRRLPEMFFAVLGKAQTPEARPQEKWPEVCSLLQIPGFRGRRGVRPGPFGRRETVPDDLPRLRVPAPVVGSQVGYRRSATPGARHCAPMGRPEDSARPPPRGPARPRLGALTTVLRPPPRGRQQARAPRPLASPASLEGASAAGRGGSERAPRSRYSGCRAHLSARRGRPHFERAPTREDSPDPPPSPASACGRALVHPENAGAGAPCPSRSEADFAVRPATFGGSLRGGGMGGNDESRVRNLGEGAREGRHAEGHLVPTIGKAGAIAVAFAARRRGSIETRPILPGAITETGYVGRARTHAWADPPRARPSSPGRGG